MARYLIVAHQTADSPELRGQLDSIRRDDANAEFVILVPATPPAHLLVSEEGEAREVAERRAQSTRRRLEQAGFSIREAKVGDPNPLDAIRDELRLSPRYLAIVVSTLPVGISRWLGLDLITRLRRSTRRSVIHVESQVQTTV